MRAKHVFWGLGLLLSAALLAAVAWKGSALLSVDGQRLAVAADCDLHREACSAALPNGGSITLSITPRPIEMQEWLSLVVELDGLEAAAVAVDFRSEEMYMGFNRPQLEAVAPGRYQGRTVLPICVANYMTWEAQVLVETSAGRLVAPFRFRTWRRGWQEEV